MPARGCNCVVRAELTSWQAVVRALAQLTAVLGASNGGSGVKEATEMLRIVATEVGLGADFPTAQQTDVIASRCLCHWRNTDAVTDGFDGRLKAETTFCGSALHLHPGDNAIVSNGRVIKLTRHVVASHLVRVCVLTPKSSADRLL